jgi:excisionase family DNA binding protein
VKRYYTPRQAAELLGVTAETLNRWADAGKVEVYRTPGGHRRYPGSELVRLTSRAALNVEQEVEV